MTDIMTHSSPTDWGIYRLGQLFSERREKGSDKDYQALSVTMKGIVPQLENAAKTDDGDNRKIVRVGDYVINSRSDRKGSGGVSKYEGSVSLISIVLEPINIDPLFAHHLLRSPAFQEEFYRWGHGIVADLWTTRYTDMKNIRLRIPDLTTQRQIADFLDRETARIDLLIEKKQRLVELLGDRYQRHRAEILSFADDEIPEQSMRWLIRVGSGDFISNEEMSSEASPQHPIPVVGGNGIMAYANKSNSPVNTLVVGRVGALCGNVHFFEHPSWVTDNALIVRLISKDMLPRYAFEVLTSAKLNEKANKSAQPLITGETVKKVKVRLPDQREQERRIKSLDDLAKRLTRTTESVLASNARLKEYRSALITAAVTGQIDVTNYAKSGTPDRRLDIIQKEMET